MALPCSGRIYRHVHFGELKWTLAIYIHIYMSSARTVSRPGANPAAPAGRVIGLNKPQLAYHDWVNLGRWQSPVVLVIYIYIYFFSSGQRKCILSVSMIKISLWGVCSPNDR